MASKNGFILDNKNNVIFPITKAANILDLNIDSNSTTRWFKVPIYSCTFNNSRFIVDRSLEVTSIWLPYDSTTNRCLYSNWTDLLSNTTDLNSLVSYNSDIPCVEYTGPTTFIPDIEGESHLPFLIMILFGNALDNPALVNDDNMPIDAEIEVDNYIAAVESHNADFVIIPNSSGGGGEVL